MAKWDRPYAEIASRVGRGEGRERRTAMQIVVDALWEGLSPRGVSWVGFYTKDPKADQMILGARRDKPACSPIGLHGVCGRTWREQRPMVVRDVAELGANYVACDPRDRSECVVPLVEQDGTCWGVLDLDSFEVGAFDVTDVDGLKMVLAAAGMKPG